MNFSILISDSKHKGCALCMLSSSKDPDKSAPGGNGQSENDNNNCQLCGSNTLDERH